MRVSKGWVSAVAVPAFLMASVSVAFGAAAHVRWDIVSLGGTPLCASSGGVASALAQDGSSIVLTGSGTFVAPAGGGGTSSATTGGGTWQTFAPGGIVSTGNGTYSVTGLVRWEEAPGSLPICDNIGNVADAHSGLAVLRVEYSDGSRGHLVVSCDLPVGTPPSLFEGVRASKGFVDYWNGTPPVGNTNRTVFHVE